MTGIFSSTGKQVSAGARLYLAQHGGKLAGRDIELVMRDDANVPDATRRLAQELVMNERVVILAGFGLTPLALAAAPIATQAKVPMVEMAAATSAITQASPEIVRTSMVIPQVTAPMAEWALQNGVRRAVTIVSDFGPGYDAEKWFGEPFLHGGGEILAKLRVPQSNVDFAPFLQRAADARPDAIFVFVPSGLGGVFFRQFAERGLDKTGIKLIGTGDVTDDDILNDMGDTALGVITSHPYSADHDSPENRAFVTEFEKANPGTRPNFFGVGGYDGMALIHRALEQTGGRTDGAALIEAMKGQAWISPRGPISIDPETRDIVQNVYLRRVEKKHGELFNVEFAVIKDVKDPAKTGA